MRPDPTRTEADRSKPGEQKAETTPAQEWGERLDTGKKIARGGTTEGRVPGAEPARAGATSGWDERTLRAVADALARLGDSTGSDAVRIAVREQTSTDLSADEVAAIRAELDRRANTPPSPDQPSPQSNNGEPARG
jgi:hypothetical protein